MAQPNQRQSINRRETNSESHDITWDLTVDNLLQLQSWPFKKTCRTSCETSPTTWNFKMSLTEVRDDGTCSLSVLLERVDSLNLELDAYIWIDICNSNETFIFPPQSFTKSGMQPGDKIQETIEITPRTNMGGAIRQNAIIFVIVRICNCHSDSKSASECNN
ncbi:unnamed protein product [Larinioides sclopetarius]|uniref:Uncharacterized protein n=1 Tax=Larinioides sclopetarius TaxID=280406 RepID=A0AAV2BQG5_9ARAC